MTLEASASSETPETSANLEESRKRLSFGLRLPYHKQSKQSTPLASNSLV